MSNLDNKLRAVADQVFGYQSKLRTWKEWFFDHQELPIQEWLASYRDVEELRPHQTQLECTEHDAIINQRLNQAIGKLESLTEERDEARRWYCYQFEDARAEADSRGWLCFKNHHKGWSPKS